MASAALNLTYSRGGDQVAIKSGEDKKVRFLVVTVIHLKRAVRFVPELLLNL